MAKVKLQKSKQLRAEAAKDWREINDGTLRFKRQDEEVAELRQLGKQELLDFMQVNNWSTAAYLDRALLWSGKEYCTGLRRQARRSCQTLLGEAGGLFAPCCLCPWERMVAALGHLDKLHLLTC